MGSLSVSIFVICFFVAVFGQESQEEQEDRFAEVKSINPIMRYWAKSRLRNSLPILDALAARSRSEGGNNEKYRNCFFSPVQCQLPVVIKTDTLTSALKMPVEPETEHYVRFRRIL